MHATARTTAWHTMHVNPLMRICDNQVNQGSNDAAAPRQPSVRK